jgi:asparagine synthase (glutamine-hydrolysing)
MCGICYYNLINNKEEILSYFNKIQHRGPDNSSYSIIDEHFFGCHRLSVININEDGNQPLTLNNIVLICNGQIYNYLELAKEHDIQVSQLRTDVDIILHLYVKGISMIDICAMLDGVFAFVLYDIAEKRHFVARDPIGVRPLFWSRDNNGNLDVVCSEIKGIKTQNKINVFPPSHIYDSLKNEVVEYFTFEKSEEEKRKEDEVEFARNEEAKKRELVDLTIKTSTLIKDYILNSKEIEELEKYIQTRFSHEPLTTKINNNQELQFSGIESFPEEKEIKNNIYNLLENAVIKRIKNSDRPVAFLCSGGIDSSIIFCIAREYMKKEGRKIHVFSMEYSTGILNQGKSFDAFYAQMLMNEYRNDPDIDYTPVKFDWEDVKKIINQMPQILETYDPNTIRASIPMYYLAKFLKENTDYKIFLSGEGADELFMGYNYFSYVEGNTEERNKLANMESMRLIKNLHMFDVLRADRTFNANGLELRVPFLDKDLVKYVVNLPGKYKLPRKGVEKYLLRETVRTRFIELIFSHVLDRQKERFSDGCGSSYVPQILNYVANVDEEVDSISLSKKEHREKTYYQSLFNEYYGAENRDLIVKRILPDFCKSKENVKDNNLLSEL